MLIKLYTTKNVTKVDGKPHKVKLKSEIWLKLDRINEIKEVLIGLFLLYNRSL